MTLLDVRQFVASLSADLRSNEELQRLHAIEEAASRLGDARRRELEELEGELSALASEVASAQQRCDQARATLLPADQHTSACAASLADQHQLKATLASTLADTQTLERERADVARQVEEVGGELERPVVDELGLRLKVFQALGFDWVVEEKSSGDQVVTSKCRVLSAGGNDVQTVDVEGKDARGTPYSRYYTANHLWNLCDEQE